MLADTRVLFLQDMQILLAVFFYKSLQLLHVLLLIYLHFFPKRNYIRMPLGVLDVITLDTPKAFMLLDILFHQIVEMIALHDVSITINRCSIAPCNKKGASFSACTCGERQSLFSLKYFSAKFNASVICICDG